MTDLGVPDGSVRSMIRAINILKSALIAGYRPTKVESTWECLSCGPNWRKNVVCSAAHPCMFCLYFPYINGIYIGCMCGVDPCLNCGGTGQVAREYKGGQMIGTPNRKVTCTECVHI